MVFPAKDLPQEADFYQFQYIKAQELTEKYKLNSLCDELCTGNVLFSPDFLLLCTSIFRHFRIFSMKKPLTRQSAKNGKAFVTSVKDF